VSSPVNVDWLNPDRLKSVTARRFAEFCIKDYTAKNDGAEGGQAEDDLYKEAAQLVIERIEAAVSGGRQ
jgi:hypothetical protein